MNFDASSSRTVRLLIVEDDDGDFLLASNCLRAAAGSASTFLRAQSLGEAIRLLHDNPTDLVLLDLALPDSRGWDTFARLREAAKNTPVIVLTGYDDQAVATRAIAAGAQDYVPKAQLNAETLARAVRYAMERHKAENALREYRDHLEQTVDARSRDLQESNRQLRAANMSLSKALEELKRHERQLIDYERVNALGQMVSGIMNDFNNLLMPVVGYSEMILDCPEILGSHDQALDILQRIRSAALNATDVVRRLRRLYRPADSEERRLLDINCLVQRVIEDTRPRWREEMAVKGAMIRVETDLDPVAPVRGREMHLAEALTHIVLNALDAMPEGGILTFRTVANGEYVTVEICDTGKGMPEHALQRCFEPFFTTKGAHATGLGLPMTRGIISDHGGEIEIASWEGQGTRVTVNLPAAPALPSAEPAAPPAPLSRELRILVIDDDVQVCRLLQTYFTRAGHRVDTAETAGEGIAKFGQSCFDVVITDHAMPDQTGDAVARAVKGKNPFTPVIMLTGFADFIKSSASLPEGVDRIVSKPVALSEMDRIVREVGAQSRPTTGAECSA